MLRPGDAAERRAFAVVLVLVIAGVVGLQLVAPGPDVGAALAADRTARAPAAPSETRVESGEADGAAPGLLERTAPDPEPTVVGDARAPRWVEDLRDDGIRGNATDAIRMLVQLPPGRVPALEAALTSPDVQQRHMAAGVLRRRDDGRSTPGAALLEVSVAALDSRLEVDVHGTWIWPLASHSARFLARHTSAAAPLLGRGLWSGDAQQRLLCAYLLALEGGARHVARVAYVLAPHLGDNAVAGDAVMAAHGLYRLGDAALPVIAEHLPYADVQARRLLELVRLDLLAPPEDRRALERRRELHDVTSLYHDPAIEFDLDRSHVPHISAR